MANSSGRWDRVIASVRNPIAFFALVVFGCFGILALAMKLGWPWVAGSMVVMIFAVVALVGYITIWYPRHFYEELQDIKQFISTKGFQDAVEDVVLKVLPRNLKEGE